ncbi:hypothetical protein ABK040_015552 [Willaertia magna]
MKRWCCVMDCNCQELLKRGISQELTNNYLFSNNSNNLFSPFFADLANNSSTNNNNQQNNILPEVSHTSLLYTTFIRSFSSCSHYVNVIESDNTTVTFLPILDPSSSVIINNNVEENISSLTNSPSNESSNNLTNDVNVRNSFSQQQPSIAMVLMIADTLRNNNQPNNNNEEDKEESSTSLPLTFLQKRSSGTTSFSFLSKNSISESTTNKEDDNNLENSISSINNNEEEEDNFEKNKKKITKNSNYTIFQQWSNETYLKVLEGLIYLLIGKDILIQISSKQTTDNIIKKIPYVKNILNSMTDIVLYLLQQSSLSIQQEDNNLFENYEISNECYLRQPFEQLTLKPGRKFLRTNEIKDMESNWSRLLFGLTQQFKLNIICSSIYVENSLLFYGLDWNKHLNSQQLISISIYLKSLEYIGNTSTIRDIPICVKENTRLIVIKLIEKIELCVIVTGNIKSTDIVNYIQSRGDEWSKLMIKLFTFFTKSMMYSINSLDEKNNILSDNMLSKVKSILFINNTPQNSYYLYENFIPQDQYQVLYERVEHSMREFFINTSMTVFENNNSTEDTSFTVNETYMISNDFAMSAIRNGQYTLFCLFSSTVPRYEFSEITKEILQVIMKKNAI